MVKCSNSLVGLLNFITFLLSIPIIGGGIWLAKKASTDCEKFLEKPIIAIGVFLMVVSLLGLCGAWCGASCLLWIYLVVMFLLIVLLFCFTVFAFVVTNKGAGEVLSDKGYKDYKLGDYSNWLQKRVQSSGNWKKIRSCVYDSKICQHLADDDKGIQNQFFSRHLSSIEGMFALLKFQSVKSEIFPLLQYGHPDLLVVSEIFRRVFFEFKSIEHGQFVLGARFLGKMTVPSSHIAVQGRRNEKEKVCYEIKYYNCAVKN